jgi:hypothetical protein
MKLKYIIVSLFLLAVLCSEHVFALSQNNISTEQSIKNILKENQPLDHNTLIKLIAGNSIIGHTCNTQSPYELYFDPNGEVIFRKNINNKEVYIGKWWIQDNIIHSQWTTYARKPTVNKLHCYHLTGNSYIIYNINKACGQPNTFGTAFLIMDGDAFNLLQLKK